MVVSLKYSVSRVVEILKSVRNQQLNERITHVFSKAFLGGGEVWNEDYSHLQLASTRPPFNSMCGTKAMRRRVKRSLNCKEPILQWHGPSSADCRVRDGLAVHAFLIIENICVIILMV